MVQLRNKQILKTLADILCLPYENQVPHKGESLGGASAILESTGRQHHWDKPHQKCSKNRNLIRYPEDYQANDHFTQQHVVPCRGSYCVLSRHLDKLDFGSPVLETSLHQ